jgi:hypothetical protein
VRVRVGEILEVSMRRQVAQATAAERDMSGGRQDIIPGEDRGWSRERLDAVAELVADTARLRARSAARRSGERGLADVIIGRLASGGDSRDVDALLRAAGLPPRYLAVAFRARRPAGAPPAGAPPAGAPHADAPHLGFDRDLAEELLAGYAGQAAVSTVGEEVLAVLGGTDGDALASWLREAGPAVAAAGITLSAGIAGPSNDAAGLAGAVREATAARRVAALRGESATPGTGAHVATSAEVDSHELLLASVPTPVLRSFAERLLGPLRDYDARHNAELLPTLKSFLDCDGSWSACASLMYVHVNTVRYRISRIEALTGRDLSALADRVDFFLALRGT